MEDHRFFDALERIAATRGARATAAEGAPARRPGVSHAGPGGYLCLLRNASSAALTSSGCVQPMLCGPPSTETSVHSVTSAGSRAAVDSNGRMRSSVPCTTSTGTSIFGRSARKSVSQVSTHAYVANGEEPAATLKL